MARILIVDNARDQRRALAAALQAKNHDVHEAEDGKDALENLRQHQYDLVITEILLSEIDGTEVINYIDLQPQKPKVIAYSAGNSQIPADMALLLVKAQVAATLHNPVEAAEIVTLVNKLLAA